MKRSRDKDRVSASGEGDVRPATASTGTGRPATWSELVALLLERPFRMGLTLLAGLTVLLALIGAAVYGGARLVMLGDVSDALDSLGLFAEREGDLEQSLVDLQAQLNQLQSRLSAVPSAPVIDEAPRYQVRVDLDRMDLIECPEFVWDTACDLNFSVVTSHGELPLRPEKYVRKGETGFVLGLGDVVALEPSAPWFRFKVEEKTRFRRSFFAESKTLLVGGTRFEAPESLDLVGTELRVRLYFTAKVTELGPR